MGKPGACLAGLTLLVALVGFGCGPSEPANAEDFVGDWQYSSGSVTYHCLGETEDVEGDISIVEGASADLSLTFNDCVFDYDLGVVDEANAGPQSCGDPATLELQLRDGKLTSDGNEMTQRESGTAVIFGSECGYTLNGTLVRM